MKEQARTRLFLPQAGQEQLIIADQEILEVARVVRLRPGETVAVFRDDPFEYYYQISGVDRRQIRLHLLGREINRANPDSICVLVQASGKAGKNAHIVKHATALGVTKIFFFRAGRSVGRALTERADRLTKVAIEACRQCGRSRVPLVVAEDLPLHTALGGIAQDDPGAALVALSPDGDCHLSSLSRELVMRGVVVVVGPEGGFSSEEKECLLSRRSHLVHLGPRILRMELASLVALALVQSFTDREHGREGSK